MCIIESITSMFEVFPDGETQVYIHNLDFDYKFILRAILENEIFKEVKYDVCVSSIDYVIRFSMSYKSKFIVFKDSAKIFKCSLKNAGLEIGLFKLPYPYEFVSVLYYYILWKGYDISSFENYVGDIREIYSDPDFLKEFEVNSTYYGFNDANEALNYFTLNNNSYTFNMRDYTTTYCCRDVAITSLFVPIYFKESVAKTHMLENESFEDNGVKRLLNYGLSFQEIEWLEKIHTAASLSMMLYTERFYEKDISLSLSEELIEFSEAAYKGGVTQLYGNLRPGYEALHMDFRMHYGTIMMESEYPCGEYVLNKRVNIKNIDVNGCYKCDVYASEDIYTPVLGIKTELDGVTTIIYPVGEFRGYWFGCEIILALELGYDVKIVEGYEYMSICTPFKKMVTHYSNFRERKGISNTVGKIIVNSLYGRMAMRGDSKSMYSLSHSENNKFKDMIEKFEKDNYVVDLSHKFELTNNYIYFIDDEVVSNLSSNIQKMLQSIRKKVCPVYVKPKKKEIVGNLYIAALITAQGRVKLFRSIYSVCNKHGGRILYTDTDSMIFEFEKNVVESLLDVNIYVSDHTGNHPWVIFDSKKHDTRITNFNGFRGKMYAVKYNKFKNNIVSKVVISGNVRRNTSITYEKFLDLSEKHIQSECVDDSDIMYITSEKVLFKKNRKDLNSSFERIDKMFSTKYTSRRWVYINGKYYTRPRILKYAHKSIDYINDVYTII